MTDNTLYDVIVIGYGAAGVAAHKHLTLGGLKTLVLEASNRIGGRINTIPFVDFIVDMGAEFVDGEEGNIVYEMAKGLDQFGSLPSRKFILTNGETVDHEISHKLVALYMSIIEDVRKKDYIDGNVSIGSIVVDEYEKRVEEPEYSDVSVDMKTDFLRWMHAKENGRNASYSWFRPSAMGYIDGFKECPGNQVTTWKYGYKTILDRMLLETLEGHYQNPDLPNNPVEYEKHVTNINYEDADGTEDHPVTVTCKDESVYKAKSILVTVSLGVLKERQYKLFTPDLPSVNQKAIVGLGFGNAAKVVISFREEWWLATDYRFGGKILWIEEDKEKLSLEESWLLGVESFYRPENQRFALTLWVTGKAAEAVEELPMETLRKHVKKLMQLIRGRDEELPELADVIRTKWRSDPLFLGAYSYRSVHSEGMAVTAEHLGRPVTRGSNSIICFAGEATSPHHYGSVHGAIETGIREANRLISQFKPTTVLQVEST